jgi:hypothetical protein
LCGVSSPCSALPPGASHSLNDARTRGIAFFGHGAAAGGHRRAKSGWSAAGSLPDPIGTVRFKSNG